MISAIVFALDSLDSAHALVDILIGQRFWHRQILNPVIISFVCHFLREMEIAFFHAFTYVDVDCCTVACGLIFIIKFAH
jgi:hypothetical protein